jgi:hypothetical protein
VDVPGSGRRGGVDGVTVAEARQVRELKRKVTELEQTLAILVEAIRFHPGGRPASAVIVSFIDCGPAPVRGAGNLPGAVGASRSRQCRDSSPGPDSPSTPPTPRTSRLKLRI